MRIRNSAKRDLIGLTSLISSLTPFAAMAALEEIPGVPSKSLTDVLNDLTAWVLGFGIAVCVLLIVWGGVNYAASAGDEERITKSKKTIHYAIYGIAIIGLSYAMIKVVSDVLTTTT